MLAAVAARLLLISHTRNDVQEVDMAILTTIGRVQASLRQRLYQVAKLCAPRTALADLLSFISYWVARVSLASCLIMLTTLRSSR